MALWPLVTIFTSLIVTWEAVTLTPHGMDRPLSTAPVPDTATKPRRS